MPENKTLGASLFEQDSYEKWQAIFETNTTAPYFVTTAFLALLEQGAKSRGPGETSSVIQISSATASRHLSFNGFAYGAAKYAVEHLAISMATEFARNEIPVRVNVIAPGGFPSEIMNLGSIEALDKFLSGPIPGAFHGTPVKRAGRYVLSLLVKA
jgi:NAD(P)-dependent dehydrogenase (short-subunit alcohol dehydrogenase family)